MLIDHDFDWEADADDSLWLEAEGASTPEPVPIATPRPPGDSLRTSDAVVIIEKSRGFSRSTLAVAVVALFVSATLKLSDSRRQTYAGVGSWLQITRGELSDGPLRRRDNDVIQPVASPRPAVEPQVVH